MLSILLFKRTGSAEGRFRRALTIFLGNIIAVLYGVVPSLTHLRPEDEARVRLICSISPAEKRMRLLLIIVITGLAILAIVGNLVGL